MGCCAIAGTAFDIDRVFLARTLGFVRPTSNSIDSVADRDFVLDFLSAASTAAIHLSRIAEDLILWVCPQFSFISFPDLLVGHSKMMPLERNPDAAELVRAKAGRILSGLYSTHLVLKGLPVSYYKDLQEDKEPLFDAADGLEFCFKVTRYHFQYLEVAKPAMRRAAAIGFTTSTDLVEWLCKYRGV